jgi:hypothetical protein
LPGLQRTVSGGDDAPYWFSNFLVRAGMVVALASLAYGASFWS